MKTKKTQSKSSKLSVGQKLKESSQLYLLMLPSIIIFLIFTYYPMYGVIIAFKDFKPALGIMESKWVGMKNFITFFKSYQFSVTIKNTIVISLYTIAVTFPLPIIMALMVNQIRSTKFKKFLQVATYLPHFISVVVMSGMIILFLSPSTGIIAKLVGLLGFKLPNLMGSASAFPHIYVWTEAWQHVGWDSILYIATLSSRLQREKTAPPDHGGTSEGGPRRHGGARRAYRRIFRSCLVPPDFLIPLAAGGAVLQRSPLQNGVLTEFPLDIQHGALNLFLPHLLCLLPAFLLLHDLIVHKQVHLLTGVCFRHLPLRHHMVGRDIESAEQ